MSGVDTTALDGVKKWAKEFDWVPWCIVVILVTFFIIRDYEYIDGLNRLGNYAEAWSNATTRFSDSVMNEITLNSIQPVLHPLATEVDASASDSTIAIQFSSGAAVKLETMGGNTLSMMPTIFPGQKLIVQQHPIDIKQGDIIEFNNCYLGQYPYLVHRVVGVIQINGTSYYQTKGDHNRYLDPCNTTDANITGRVVGTIYSGSR